MKKKTVSFVRFLLIALFVSYYASNTLFIHTHTFAGGTVTHSHPFLPDGGHNHSKAEYQTIAAFNLLALVAIAIAIVIPKAHYRKETFIPTMPTFKHYTARYCSLRAPPYTIC